MSTPFHNKSDWGGRAARSISKSINPEGVTCHYGGGSPWTSADRSSAAKFRKSCDHNRCASIVRAYQNYHMNTHGWVDGGYTSLVCPHGHRYNMRGPGVRTAGQGTNSGNYRSYAVCYIAGDNDPLTDEAKAAYRDEASRLRVPLRWIHSDWKSTACPGPFITGWKSKNWTLAKNVDVSPSPTPEVPSPSGRFQRTKELQSLVGTKADGIFGPLTERACKQNMVGWTTYVRRMNSRVPHLGGNNNRTLVRWIQVQGVRKGAYPANLLDGLLGPKTNHIIVVALKQQDGICGPKGYKQAVR